MKRILAITVIFALVFGMFGCSLNAATAGGDAGKTEAKKEKILTVTKEADLHTMDTQLATDGLSFEVIASTVNGLYYTDGDGNAVPALAEKTEVSPDGLQYTFTIRDAKWSNGTPVTAHDFVFGWRRLVDPESASEYAYMMEVAGVKNGLDCSTGKKPVEELGVKAIDDKTLVVELDRAIPFFVKLMTFVPFYPSNQAFMEEKGDQYCLTPETTLACGPFKLSEWYPGSSFKLVKNDTYWDKDVVKLDAINFKVVLDSQSAVLEYESKATDYVRLTGEMVEKYRNHPDFTTTLGSYLWFLSVNQKKGDLSNKNLNNALAYAFNREQIANAVLNDSSIEANFFVPVKLATGPDGKDFRDTAPKYFTDGKDKAKEYWEKAKAEIGKDTVTIELLFEDSEASKKVAEFMKAEIETTLEGLTVELKSQPKKTRLKLMDTGDYEVCLTRWGPDYQDPMTFLELFVTDASYNYGSYSDPAYDQLIADCKAGKISLEERWELMKEAEKVLLMGGGPIPVYQTGASTLWNPRVKDVYNYSVGVPYSYKFADIVE